MAVFNDSMSLSRRPFLAAGTASAVFGALRSAVAAESAPVDHELLTLGAALREAWANERAIEAKWGEIASDEADAEFETAAQVSADLVKKIEELPAMTLTGLRVKALAFSWTQCGDKPMPEMFGDQGTTDAQLAASIIRDLLVGY